MSENLTDQILEKIDGFKEMIDKSATVEEFNALKSDFESFRETTDGLSDHTQKMQDLEQSLKKLNDRVGKMSINDGPGGQTLYQQIKGALESDEWAEYVTRDAKINSPITTLKSIDWGAAGGNGTNDVVHNYMPFQVPQYPFEEPFDMRMIAPQGTSSTASLDYPQELVYTDGMGVVAETDASGETDITFQMVTENASRMATHANVSRRALRNTSWLAAYLTNRFNEKFVKLLNTQTLVGDGLGENFNGIYTQATTWDVTVGPPDFSKYVDVFAVGETTLIDAVLAMKSQLYELSNVKANALFCHPFTAWQLTGQKATTREFVYDQILDKVAEDGVYNINNMTIFETKDIPSGDALIGLVSPNVFQLLNNGGIDMSSSQSHSTNFTSNLITFRFEGDFLFPVYRPYAFLKGTLATVLDDITAAT